MWGEGWGLKGPVSVASLHVQVLEHTIFQRVSLLHGGRPCVRVHGAGGMEALRPRGVFLVSSFLLDTRETGLAPGASVELLLDQY